MEKATSNRLLSSQVLLSDPFLAAPDRLPLPLQQLTRSPTLLASFFCASLRLPRCHRSHSRFSLYLIETFLDSLASTFSFSWKRSLGCSGHVTCRSLLCLGNWRSHTPPAPPTPICRAKNAVHQVGVRLGVRCGPCNGVSHSDRTGTTHQEVYTAHGGGFWKRCVSSQNYAC